LHAANAFAVISAFKADFRAFSASVLVVLRPDQHKVGRSSAHFSAGHHKPEVVRLGVFATHLQAV
jgi:hypothetical protein